MNIEKPSKAHAEDEPWMSIFGELRSLHVETTRINQIIEREFGQLEPEDIE